MAAFADQKAAAAAADQKLAAAFAELKAAAAEQKAAAAEQKAAAAEQKALAAEQKALAAELKALAAELKAAAAELKAAAEVAVDPDLKAEAEAEAEAADQKAAALEKKAAALEKKAAAAEQKAASMEQEVAAAEQEVAAAKQKVVAAEQKAAAAEQKAAAAKQQVKAATAAAVGKTQEIMVEEDKKELHNLLPANRIMVIFIVVAVFACILIGTISIHYLEDIDYEEALYLFIKSTTAVGYENTPFKTWQGRLLSSIVLLFATLAVAKWFGFLADVKNKGIQQSFEQSKLDRECTLDDMLGADMNHCCFIREPEFLIYKFMDMGRISKQDLRNVRKTFKEIDSDNVGKM